MEISEKSLIASAQQAIGAGEQVLAAGVFQPRGSSGGGSLVGNIMSALPGGELAGAMVEAEAETKGFLAANTLLAVTPQHVFAFRGTHDGDGGFRVTESFATWDRNRIGVSVGGRGMVRTLEIKDLDTGQLCALETQRFSGTHTSAVIKLLRK